MPVHTELEWAKEICKRQGYYVIQQSRVRELFACASVADYEWDMMKTDARFKRYMWEKLVHDIASKVAHEDDVVLRDERDMDPTGYRPAKPGDLWRHPEGQPEEALRPFVGHIFQARLTVITYV
jgi:hypothetical protein